MVRNVIGFVALICILEISQAAPIKFQDTELGKEMFQYVLHHFIDTLNPSWLVPESYEIRLLDTVTYHDTTYYAVCFRYADHGYGNRTTSTVCAALFRLSDSIHACAISYHGAVDDGKFTRYGAALFIEYLGVYSVTGWVTNSYSICQVRPKSSGLLFSRRLVDYAQIHGEEIDNSFIKLTPCVTNLPDTILVYNIHQHRDGKSGRIDRSRRLLELYHLDYGKRGSDRIDIAPGDSTRLFESFNSCACPVRFEDALEDTLPRTPDTALGK